MILDSQMNRLLMVLHSAPMQPELWDVFLADLSRLCDVSKAALIVHDFVDREHTISISFGDAVKESVRDYESHYCQFDEWTTRFPKDIAAGTLVQGADIWPEESFNKSVFYNEFLQRFDTCEMIAVLGGRSKLVLEALSFYRGPREAPFDSRQLAPLQAIASHLQIALAMRRKFLSLKSQLNDAESALDQLGTALVLVDSAGKPVLANRAARKICDQRDGLYLSTSRLSAMSPTENSRLREIVAKAAAAGKFKNVLPGGSVLISRKTRRPLQVLVAPFFSQNSAIPNRAAAAVFISDPDQMPVPRFEILRDMYRLTPAESRLAILLLEGKSLSDTAESMGITHETARSQIKSVLHKTGTGRQGELIRLLSCLPNENA